MKELFKNKRSRQLVTALLSALAVALICAAGALNRPDKWLQDTLYEHPEAVSGDVVVIGIDEEALEELGPYNTWDRNVMAAALEALAADPARLPAVVAVDALYIGESDPAADERLAKAAAKLGNVVTGSSAQFGNTLVQGSDGRFYRDNYAILNYEEPYAALKDAGTVGHINAMYDMDGIMRHAILYVEPEAGRRVYSMAWEAAKLFASQQGMDLTEPAVDARGHYFLPYTGDPGAFYDGVSIADLIRGDVPADYYDGRIVLIGPYAAGLQDAYLTPIDRAQQMYGVEIQANAVECILSGNYKSEAGRFPQALVLFIVCALLMWIFLKLSVAKAGILAAAALALSIGAAYLLYQAGIVVHPLWIPFGTALLYVGSVASHYVQAALERVRVTRTFERYVAPEVVQEILREGTDSLGLGGKAVEIAVLFVDIRGFTTMSERLQPEQVVYILNRYLTMTSSCVEKNHGTLDKFVGDCTMAFWGAPFTMDDPVYHACRTAMDIVQGAEELSAKLEAETGETLRCGVGVNYGPAVVGNIGSEKHMDYTAIGDTVNTAARLEANAPGGMVYISRVVADMLGDRAKTTSLGGSIRLKGKKEGFEVLSLEELQ